MLLPDEHDRIVSVVVVLVIVVGLVVVVVLVEIENRRCRPRCGVSGCKFSGSCCRGRGCGGGTTAKGGREA